MAKIIINNRGTKKKPSWQYRFETAKVDGKRRYVSKAGFRTKEEAEKAGTIAKIVISMGGDLNELIGYEKKKEIEVNSTVSLKETYEMRISDLIDSYDRRIEDIKELCEMRIIDVQKCYEARIADTKKIYEERLAAQREYLKNINNL